MYSNLKEAVKDLLDTHKSCQDDKDGGAEAGCDLWESLLGAYEEIFQENPLTSLSTLSAINPDVDGGF